MNRNNHKAIRRQKVYEQLLIDKAAIEKQVSPFTASYWETRLNRIKQEIKNLEAKGCKL